MFDDPSIASLADALRREARKSLEAFGRTPRGMAVRGAGALALRCRAEGRGPSGDELSELLELARGAVGGEGGV